MIGAGLHALIERWKLVASVVVAVLASLWYVVTFADDKIRKADQVPAIAEAVLQLKANEELGELRLKRLEERMDRHEENQSRANALIIDRLDQLLQERTHVR